MPVSLTDQLKCATRELALRQRVYGKWVAERKMPKSRADAQIAAMDAIVQTLQKLIMLEEVSQEIRQKSAEPSTASADPPRLPAG